MASLNEAIARLLATPQYPNHVELNSAITNSYQGLKSNPKDLRADGTPKGLGYFGALKRPGGGVSTEISIGTDFGLGQMEIPTMVPTLTSDEVNHLLNTSVDQTIPRPIVDKAVAFARQRQAQGLSPFAQSGEIPYGIKQEMAFDRFPVRKPFLSELDYFKNNPNVAGMATEDNAIILNPNNPNIGNPTQRNSVIQNEGIRLLINSIDRKPDFEVTPAQRASFKGTPYEKNDQAMRETIAARIFSGDPSAGSATSKQLEYVNFLKGQIPK